MSDDDWNFDYPKIARDSGFKFRQYNDGIIDWRQIGGIEVEKILQNQNIEKLDSIIFHLAEVPLGSLLKSNILESGVAKYFLLSQLAIQYLIFCKRFLDETVTSMRSTLKELQSENTRFKKIEQEHSDDVLQLHKELQKLRNINEVVFPCSMCTKNFVSNEMLNIHISRKHSNELHRCNANVSEKRTEKQNDNQLISTIKLELEIKHLKERLNDAEKVIRTQTFEISRQIEEIRNSPRTLQTSGKIEEKQEKLSTPTINVGTQNEVVSMKNIGIQSNLVEDKERDDIDTMEKDQILEIFKKINEKITHIEKVRDDDLKSRQKTLQEFENKLQNVTQVIEAKQQYNLDILNKFTDKMSSQTSLNQEINLDELKEFLNNAMEKIQNENRKQLHQLAQKFDQTYLDKMDILKAKIEKANEIEVKQTKIAPIDLKTIISRNKEIAQILTNKGEIEKKSSVDGSNLSKIPQPIIKVGRKTNKSITPVTKLVRNKDETSLSESSQLSETSDETETETESSDSTLYAEKRNDKKPKSSSEIRSSKTLSVPSKDTSKSKYEAKFMTINKSKENQNSVVPPLKLEKPSHSISKIVRKMQEDRLKAVGISFNTKSVATSSMPQINEDLADIRRNKKKLFPKFNTTRSYLKNLVNQMTGSKSIKQPAHSRIAMIKSSTRSNLENMQESSSQSVNGQSESEIENSISSKSAEDDKNEIESPVGIPSTSKQEKEEFKSKLDRILSSPIHKLKKATIDNSASKTPIPTPRKKVMFDFALETAKEENSSSVSDDERNKNTKV